MLTRSNKTELREAVVAWHEKHPTPKDVLGARAVGLAAQVAKTATTSDGSKPAMFSTCFGLISWLASTRRCATPTRLFAERALHRPWMRRHYCGGKPNSWPECNSHAGSPAYDFDSTQLAASLDRFTHVAEQLPAQVSSEREEIVKALESQEKQLTRW